MSEVMLADRQDEWDLLDYELASTPGSTLVASEHHLIGSVDIFKQIFALPWDEYSQRAKLQ